MKNIALCMVLLVGCSVESQSRNLTDQASSSLIYFKDVRTNLCFVRFDRGIATVPCEAVKKLLPKGDE